MCTYSYCLSCVGTKMIPNTTKMPNWDGALCRETDPEIFFPEFSGLISTRIAKRICNKCELKQECLGYALKDYNLQGIWGGTNQSDRDIIRAQRNRLKKTTILQRLAG